MAQLTYTQHMKNTKKLLVFCTIIVLSATNSAKAVPCSCQDITIAEAVKYANIVFKGRVISKTTTSNLAPYSVTVQGDTSNSFASIQLNAPVSIVRIKMDKKYKGKSQSDTITVITASRGAACGVGFQVGETYIVFGNTNDFLKGKNLKRFATDDKTYFAHLCSRTSQYSESEEREIQATKD